MTGIRRWDGRKVEEVGNAQGLIAIFCDKTQALDIAEHYGYPDTFGVEIIRAVERAYPPIQKKEATTSGA